jgi:hypothetical protein
MRKCNAELYHNLVRMQPRKHAALIDRAASIHNPSCAQVPMRSCGLDMRTWGHQGGRIFPPPFREGPGLELVRLNI